MSNKIFRLPRPLITRARSQHYADEITSRIPPALRIQETIATHQHNRKRGQESSQGQDHEEPRRISFKQWLESAKSLFLQRIQNPTQPTSSLKDYTLLKTIGEGSFGRVEHVQHKLTKEYCALKILNKEALKKSDHIDDALNEKKVLAALNFPFIVNLRSSFKDSTNLYLVLEYVPGGDLFSLVNDRNFIPVEHARFYCAQLVLVFEYLHTLGVVYRDLKLENVLIDAHGYIKLTDFGFAMRLEGKSKRKCGTAEYMAPEITLYKGYNHSVDWWALGILLYEMCTGRTPFYSDSKVEIGRKSALGRVKYPRYFPRSLRDIIANLLQVDVEKRFGNQVNGATVIKNHAFFIPINFQDLFERKVKPPYIPRLPDGLGDTSHFVKIDHKELRISLNEHCKEEFETF